jgi:hypothetical protein
MHTRPGLAGTGLFVLSCSWRIGSACLSVLSQLGVFFVALNYFYLSFMQIHTHFYINYIIYYGLLIFCCQNVATHLL